MKKRWGVLIALGGGIGGGALVWLMQKGSLSLQPGAMTYEQLAALMLGFASLILTTLGVGVAVLAWWGYSHFRTMVEDSAQSAAVRKVDEELKGGELRNHVELVVTNYLEKGFRDGSLLGFLESRKGETDKLKEVDEGWRDLGGVNEDVK